MTMKNIIQITICVLVIITPISAVAYYKFNYSESAICYKSNGVPTTDFWGTTTCQFNNG